MVISTYITNNNDDGTEKKKKKSTVLSVRRRHQTAANNINNEKEEEGTRHKASLYQTSIRDAIAGAAAGAFAKTTMAPIERVKLLLQLQGSIIIQPSKTTTSTTSTSHRVYHYNGAWDAARMIYKQEGLLAFWRGNTPNVIRQAGAAGLNFMFMDWYKQAIKIPMNYYFSSSSSSSSSSSQTKILHTEEAEAKQKRFQSLLSSFLSGGLAGGTATTILYPMDFIRTRLAMDINHNTLSRQYPNGMRDVFIQTIQSNGIIGGFYQGYGIALVGVVLYRALHLGGYDCAKMELLHYKQTNNNNTSSSNHNNNNNHRTTAAATTTTMKLSMTERFLLAQCISVIAGTICYPIDSVRRRLMMEVSITGATAGGKERKYRNAMDCFYKVLWYEKGGIRGLYLGLGPNIVRSFGGAFLLVGYDIFREMI